MVGPNFGRTVRFLSKEKNIDSTLVVSKKVQKAKFMIFV